MIYASISSTRLLLTSLAILSASSFAAEVAGQQVSPEENTILGNNNDNNIQTGPKQQVASTNVVMGSSGEQAIAAKIQKCSRQSLALTRQALTSELEQINQFNPFWFNDLDKEELMEEQKQSLSSLIMSGGHLLGAADSSPQIEVETSYLRPLNRDHLPANVNRSSSHWVPVVLSGNQSTFALADTNNGPPTINIRLVRRHQDRCYLHKDKAQYTLVLALAVGPFEHNLDVVQNLPKELRLSQPIDWRFGQVKLLVNRMNYEVTFKQAANYNRLSTYGGCPLEVSDVTFLNSQVSQQPQVSILSSGLAINEQSLQQLKSLFNHYTRPAISNRLRQALKFYLSAKTLPLATVG